MPHTLHPNTPLPTPHTPRPIPHNPTPHIPTHHDPAARPGPGAAPGRGVAHRVQPRRAHAGERQQGPQRHRVGAGRGRAAAPAAHAGRARAARLLPRLVARRQQAAHLQVGVRAARRGLGARGRSWPCSSSAGAGAWGSFGRRPRPPALLQRMARQAHVPTPFPPLLPPSPPLSPPASEDTKLRLWDVASGQLLRTFSQHRDAVTCCCWMPDSCRFLSAGPDKAIFMFDTEGNELQRWRRQHRVQVRRGQAPQAAASSQWRWRWCCARGAPAPATRRAAALLQRQAPCGTRLSDRLRRVPQDMALVGGGSCLVVACSSDRQLQVGASPPHTHGLPQHSLAAACALAADRALNPARATAAVRPLAERLPHAALPGRRRSSGCLTCRRPPSGRASPSPPSAPPEGATSC
jgi:hypothetical protein